MRVDVESDVLTFLRVGAISEALNDRRRYVAVNPP
jgi:hypothetical protein